jgi:berberine-like enzyme
MTQSSPLDEGFRAQFGGEILTAADEGYDIHSKVWNAMIADTAFGHRDAPFLVNEIATWTDQEEAAPHIAWARGLSAALQPFSAGSYVNFLVQEGAQVTKAAYTEASYERLVALKTTYDPTNLFRLNQNIPPREKGAARL